MPDRRPAEDPPPSRDKPARTPAQTVSWFEARISGRVQGVGFRWWTVETAESLGVNGWVRNCANGDVEVEAEGPRSTLEEFANRLREGPTLARVRDLSISWGDRPPRFRRFGVDY